MNTKNLKQLKLKWNDICDDYLYYFIRKHKFSTFGKQYEDMWLNGERGSWCMIQNMYISFIDIRYDIDNDIPAHMFEDFYWENIKKEDECGIYTSQTFQDYCKGYMRVRKELDNSKELFDSLF